MTPIGRVPTPYRRLLTIRQADTGMVPAGSRDSAGGGPQMRECTCTVR